MRTLLKDVQFGWRVLAKNRAFAAVAVLTLALGISANTVLFSVVNGVLLNPLPFPQPDRLVALYTRTPTSPRWSISYPNFLDWVRDNHSLSALAGYRVEDFTLAGAGEPERVSAEMVSASFFPLLGVQPSPGRAFLPEEDQPGAPPVALISSGLWKRKFGGAPSAVGKTLTLDGAVYTIVGVIPPNFQYIGFNFDSKSDLYVPIGQWTNPNFLDRRTGMGMDAVGRLKPGVTFEQARADMDGLAHHLAEAYPEADKGTGITLVPLKQNVVGDIQPFLLMLLAAVAFVLLIACVNVANLMLARSTARTQEFAIRTALGANSGRVVRQLLTESLLLALAGGGLGAVIASGGIKVGLSALSLAVPRAEEIRLDGRVLLFTLTVSTLAGILFGIVPALKTTRTDVHLTLKEGGRGLSGTRHRTQGLLVASEMALALVLLAGAGLMMRSLAKLWSVNPGFEPHHLLTFRVAIPTPPNAPASVSRAFWRDLQGRLTATPGVRSASLTVGAVPMQGDSELNFWLEGQPKPATQAEMPQATFYTVQPGYLEAMGIPLRRGRFLNPADTERSPFVVVIDERFSRLFFKNQDPIGKHVHFGISNSPAEVVGVVGHVKQWGLDGDATSPIQAQCYLDLAQVPDQYVPLLAGFTGVVLRTAGAPHAQLDSIRIALPQINSAMVIYRPLTFDEIIADSLAARRFSMFLLGLFAAIALVMSCVGIYGVVSYIAGQRTHEIGIRVALGADRWQVMRMMMGQGAQMALVGVGIGLVAALGLTRLMTNMLYGVSPHDPLSFAGMAALLLLVALAACAIPARRAARLDPLVALRDE